jgi:hypothetical protein
MRFCARRSRGFQPALVRADAEPLGGRRRRGRAIGTLDADALDE